MRSSHFNPSLLNAFRLPVAAFVPLWILTGAASFASAQNARNAAASETREWAQGAIDHAQQMRIHKDSDQGSQPTPPIIKKLDIDDDPGGAHCNIPAGRCHDHRKQCVLPGFGNKRTYVRHLPSEAER